MFTVCSMVLLIKDKKHAEKMFMDIAAAKEVLTNPGMCRCLEEDIRCVFDVI